MPSVKPSTVLGRQLGDELRRFREQAGLSTAEAADVLDCTKGKISRIENGHVPVRTPDLIALMHAYEVADPDARERLASLARTANRRRREGWWHQYGSVLADTYRDYIEMETICDSIRTYQVQLVPGLLQTPEYGRAVTVASRAWQTPEEIEQFVQVRLARQERLTGADPLELWAVLAEGVLHQQVGGRSVMRAQLDHLASLAERPNVTVQVLPFSRGAHPGMFGPYLLLSFPRVSALDLVLTETPTGNIWMERESEVSRYRDLFDDARTSALPPTDSLSLIRRIAKEYRP
ncbi:MULTISPECIES: helix-turn-helix domain-containing protein [Streptomyces]|uniref:Transcriptional regulator with XRE-family HTH domain n=1 Tax=Streptomyces clavifer TaxID=68188 RepID=A0ABS4V567_9ACTN|nr:MULTISPECIES: helix-turn-helix transcriptional regulator [Streptomyces]KQX81085.1 DNA-binding protein [Streptomyces sp. Root1319]KQZ06938.1 DNA-binding protein [Streptomyces sp. Root55]MBP2359047.1 transcriptional regulator with XRE-family HTH domain [Streptomyces clavifer]MDX2745724.1 helix-turn-helix transcriptional regulator [Streptomyces sp. NRRL_B-2557]MDX3062320.1 helix-turn-helix transcriptional regulator [Streptomyces sp. ND04-05B]